MTREEDASFQVRRDSTVSHSYRLTEGQVNMSADGHTVG